MWSTLFFLILEFVGPIIAELIREWLAKAASEVAMENATQGIWSIDSPLTTPRAELQKLLDRAVAEIPWYRFVRKRLMRVVRDLVMNRAEEFLRNNGKPSASVQMTQNEAALLAAAVG